MRREHFSARTYYHVVEIGGAEMMESLQKTYDLPTEAVVDLWEEAREVGSRFAILGLSGGLAETVVETVVLPPDVSCARAFQAITQKFGTRFDAEQVLLSYSFAESLGEAIGVYFHRAPESVQ